MTTTMQMTAALVPILPFKRKNRGTPIAAPLAKQINCLFARLNMTFVFTAV